jgi:flagellar basal-body rod modification protein FlgD
MPDVAPVGGAPSTSRAELWNEVETKKTESIRTPSNELDKDAFLQLLVTQLRYQDPSKPMDASQFMAQNAQLTSVEKLTELADMSRSMFTAHQRMAASSLVGSDITWEATDGATHTGTVDSASLATDVPTLTVAGNTVRMDEVRSVTRNPNAG